MKVSAITENLEDAMLRRNDFIRFSNRFMSNPEGVDAVGHAQTANGGHARLGIENLQEFTIFPREVIDGRTVVTA